MDNSKAKELIERYKLGTINPVEKQMLEDWYLKMVDGNQLNLEDGELENNLNEVWQNIRLNTLPAANKPKKYILWKSIAAAATILLVAGLYLYTQKSDPAKRLKYTATIQPGGNRATLTLADGKVITLDDAKNGELVEQAGISISKAKDGQLVYTVNDGTRVNGKELINTIRTPNGGQYQINLPDGSRVWLNAGSSLRYPVRFNTNERRVTLTGEAYFEIAKVYSSSLSQSDISPQRGERSMGANLQKARVPFIVVTAGQQVEVLGTHFNINAYADEPGIKTTLLEGSVKVGRRGTPGDEVVLKPGQQSRMAGNKLDVTFVNTGEAIAWKNGMFMFKDADLKMVMRAISRWYDVEVSYEGTLPDKEFSGDIYRNLDLNQVLDVLSFYKVHFRVEGKKIIVTP